jgi:hypothetical protein
LQWFRQGCWSSSAIRAAAASETKLAVKYPNRRRCDEKPEPPQPCKCEHGHWWNKQLGIEIFPDSSKGGTCVAQQTFGGEGSAHSAFHPIVLEWRFTRSQQEGIAAIAA